MQLKIYIMTLVFLLFGTIVLAQEKKHTEICIDFRGNQTVVDTAYMDNASNLREMKSFLQTVLNDSTVKIVEVSLCAAASPEGNVFVTEKKIQPVAPIEKKTETIIPEPAPVAPDTIAPQVPDSIVEQPIQREPMLAVRTNLLYDLAIAVNVGVEYYTRNPHWSILAHYTFPWWSNRKNHLFMQVLDGCIEPRFYLDGKAGHTGHYLSVYGQANLYDIGFNEELGWQGEGWSFGLGYGRVWQPWKNKKWKLEAFIRVGYYHSVYDPYHAGEPGNDKYYYDWEGPIENFVRRNHRLRWFGPTGLGITLSYDLLNRKVIKERK